MIENIHSGANRSGQLVKLEVFPMRPPHLSSREKQTLNYVSHGLTSYEIAEKLSLSRDTIETHRRRIMRKLNATNIVQAVALGIRNKII